jgi:hypothetical protein
VWPILSPYLRNRLAYKEKHMRRWEITAQVIEVRSIVVSADSEAAAEAAASEIPLNFSQWTLIRSDYAILGIEPAEQEDD